MFTPASARAAASYRQASIDSSTPHQLVNMLLDGVLQSVCMARSSLQRSDMPAKCEQIARAVRLIEEGLRLGLDEAQGGDIAANLRRLYDYSVRRLTMANLRNDDVQMAEVQGLFETLAEGWRGIAGNAATAAPRLSATMGA